MMCRLPHDDLCESSSNLELVAEQVWDRWMLWLGVSLVRLKSKGDNVGKEQQQII